MISWKHGFVFFTLASLAAAAQAQNLIVNHSFEDPDQGSGYGIVSSIPGWTATTGSIEIGHGSVYNVTGQDGDQVVELDVFSNSTIEQSVTTVVGRLYTLTVAAATRGGTSQSSNLVDILLDGTPLTTITPTSSAFADYSFTVTGGFSTLSLRGTGDSDGLGSMVDNVRLVEAVPEPASLAALGLGAIALIRRRRK